MAKGDAATLAAMHTRDLQPTEADIKGEWAAAKESKSDVASIKIPIGLIVRAIKRSPSRLLKGPPLAGLRGDIRYPHMRLILGCKQVEKWLQKLVERCVPTVQEICPGQGDPRPLFPGLALASTGPPRGPHKINGGHPPRCDFFS